MGKNEIKRLREKAKSSPGGWSYGDLEKLLLASGFTKTEGGNHTLFEHPDLDVGYPVTRGSGELKTHYVRNASKIIEQVNKATVETKEEKADE